MVPAGRRLVGVPVLSGVAAHRDPARGERRGRGHHRRDGGGRADPVPGGVPGGQAEREREPARQPRGGPDQPRCQRDQPELGEQGRGEDPGLTEPDGQEGRRDARDEQDGAQHGATGPVAGVVGLSPAPTQHRRRVLAGRLYGGHHRGRQPAARAQYGDGRDPRPGDVQRADPSDQASRLQRGGQDGEADAEGETQHRRPTAEDEAVSEDHRAQVSRGAALRGDQRELPAAAAEPYREGGAGQQHHLQYDHDPGQADPRDPFHVRVRRLGIGRGGGGRVLRDGAGVGEQPGRVQPLHLPPGDRTGGVRQPAGPRAVPLVQQHAGETHDPRVVHPVRVLDHADDPHRPVLPRHRQHRAEPGSPLPRPGGDHDLLRGGRQPPFQQAVQARRQRVTQVHLVGVHLLVAVRCPELDTALVQRQQPRLLSEEPRHLGCRPRPRRGGGLPGRGPAPARDVLVHAFLESGRPDVHVGRAEFRGEALPGLDVGGLQEGQHRGDHEDREADHGHDQGAAPLGPQGVAAGDAQGGEQGRQRGAGAPARPAGAHRALSRDAAVESAISPSRRKTTRSAQAA